MCSVQATLGATFAAGDYVASPTTLSTALSLEVDEAYIATLGDINGDGVLTQAEIAAGRFIPIASLTLRDGCLSHQVPLARRSGSGSSR